MTSIATGNAYLDSLASATSAAKSNSNQTIDQSGFLKLLSAQLTTQDPTEPTDNSQMVQQMATFSQVAGIAEMNSSLKGMATDISASRFGGASSLVGRAALVGSSVVAAASNGAYAGAIGLPADSGDVTLNLVDSSGQTVYAKDLGAHAAGSLNWNWDGKDASGKAIAGPLKMIVNATNAANTGTLSPTLSAWTEIASVQSPASGTTKLVTALGSFGAGDVQALS